MISQKERQKVDAFLENKLIVHRRFNPLDISNGIDWNFQEKSNPDTFQTYLHSLGIINSLMSVSIYDDNVKLEKFARDIIRNWYRNNQSATANHAWQEHPTSSRLNNIVEFIKKSEKYKFSSRYIKEILIKHCDFLYSENNYKFNNHGLMMDYALLNASEYIDDDIRRIMYVDKALYRIRYGIRRDFTRRGVHLENSPEYHRMVLIIYKKIERKCRQLKIQLGKQEKEILKLAEDFKSIMIQPNQLYPLIGDTGSINDKKIKKSYKNFYDQESGLAILHNYNKRNPENSSMLTFKSGYFSSTHKHYDDLSVTLFLDGLELLVDSGKYSYNKENPIRDYMISPEAHNTIYFPRKRSYKLSNPIQEQSLLKLVNYKLRKNYVMCSGINKLYPKTNIIRYNILTQENMLIIVDRVVTSNMEDIVQNFNINEKAIIKKINELKYEIKIDDKVFILKSFERHDTVIKSELKTGYVSRVFGDYEENKRIIFNQNTKNATFITAIFTEDIESRIANIILRNNKIIYTLDNKNTVIEL